MKNGYMVGMLAGAIAGLADGIVSNIAYFIGSSLEFWGAPYAIPGYLTFTYLFWGWLANIPLNILWGVIFGLAFAIVYDCFPGKGIMKGIYFGLLFYFLLSNIRMGSFSAQGGDYTRFLYYGWHGFFASLAYGSVLGYLYKPKK